MFYVVIRMPSYVTFAEGVAYDSGSAQAARTDLLVQPSLPNRQNAGCDYLITVPSAGLPATSIPQRPELSIRYRRTDDMSSASGVGRFQSHRSPCTTR
jgi:hypothetical protein